MQSNCIENSFYFIYPTKVAKSRHHENKHKTYYDYYIDYLIFYNYRELIKQTQLNQ